MPDLAASLASFFTCFAGAVVYGAAFCLIYVWLTPHKEFALIVREHNASAAIAFGGSLIGFAIALAGAIHNISNLMELAVWGLVAVVTQIVAYGLARLTHPGLSHAIEQNAIAAAVWLAAVSIAAGTVSAACMSP